MSEIETKAAPKMIFLGIPVSGGGEGCGPFFAVLALDRAAVERLLCKATAFRRTLKVDGELYKLTWFDYSPDFCESGAAGDDAGTIQRIFDAETYPQDDTFVEFTADEAPAVGNVRLDYCELVVANGMSRGRPGLVDFYWTAGIKNTGVVLETCEIPEDGLRTLLARL